MIVVFSFLTLLDLGFELDLSEISGLHILLLSIFACVALTFNGILSKEVNESDEKYLVSYMYGIIEKEFIKSELFSNYSDSNLVCPSGPILVSNEHIKLNDGHKKTIIYPIGTSDFEKLTIRLKKQQGEQEDEE